MKTIKRYLWALLAVVMVLTSVTAAPAFAAELSDDDVQPVVDEIAITSSTVNQTFTMGSYHRGGDRAYSTSHLYVCATITGSNGNAVNSTVDIVLKDYNGNEVDWFVPADGITHAKVYNIVPGRVYYFEYYRSGIATTLSVHMIIDPV